MKISTRSSQRPNDRLTAIEARQKSRFLDLYLELRAPKADGGELLLAVGGVWDRAERRYTGELAARGRVIYLKRSQVGVARYLAGWLEKYRAGAARDRVLMLGGRRRGGKTVALVLAVLVLALEVPGAICWLVSPTFERREEIEEVFRGRAGWPGIPRAWWRYKGTPRFKFYLANGSGIRNLSGAVPQSLKRGGADVFLLNEAQEMPPEAATYAIPAIIDRGGLALLAANPPQITRGEWTIGFRQKLIDGKLAGSYIPIDPSLNDSVDQSARADVAEILRAIDPRAAAADAEDLWLPLTERAYPKWSENFVAPLPTIADDITAATLKRLAFVAYPTVCGGDFQGRPHQAAALLRIFGGPSGPIYWFFEELVVEGTELHLSDEAYSQGYRPETLLWVPDASGEWQDSKRSPGGSSYDILRSQRWNVQAPTEIKRPDRSRYPKNPDVDRRLGLLFQLMAEDRIRVDPRCTWLIEAFAGCPLGENRYGKRRPWGSYSHITDAAGYVLWFLEPKKRRVLAPPTPGSVRVVDVGGRGPKTL